MTFSIKSCVQTYCLFTLLLLAALLSQGKEKIETPHKPTEGKNSVPTLHIPWIYRSHPMLSKPAQLLSLDPIRFSLHANKQVITVGEEVEITITAQLLDIPASAFFVFEEQRGFALKLLLPEGFIQTSGDYQEYIGGKLTASNSTFTKRLRGVFTSIPENPCFVLLRGAYHANSSSIFEQKHRLCLTKKSAPQATRVADCISPWIAVQNKTCGTSSYSLNISVSQDAVVTTNIGQISGTAPNYTITNIPLTSELILTATNCDKQVSLTLPVAPCQSCPPPTVTVGVPNCGTTTYSFGVDMFNGATLTSNYGTIVGTAPHFAINDISLGQNITLTATSANGCQSTIIVSGSACGTGNNNGGSCTPPILTPITPQTICYGGSFYSVNTSVSNAVEVYYQWYNDNGSANNNTNPIEGENRANLRSFPTSPGEYKYKVVATSSANSTCTASQSVTLTVHASPTISSTTATNPNCVPRYGGTVLVTGAGGSSLLYSKDDGGNWMDLTGINAQNEIARNTMLYTPQKDIAKVKITLEEGFGLLPGGEYTGEIRNESSPPTFDDLAAGTYNIRVKDENGCISAPSAVTLSNPNAPAIFNVTGGGTCLSSGASAPIYLSGSVTGVNYYLLRNGIVVSGAIAGTGGQLYFANHSTDGTYTVMASNASNSCSSQMNNSAIISSGTPPTAPANSEGDKIFCASKTNLLSVSVGAGKTADWYSTSTGGTPVSGGTGVVDFTPSTAGVYYVETRDIATKCKSTTRTPVTLYAAPTLSITGASSIGCENPTALLSAETNISLPTSIPVSYTWKKGGNTSAVATTSTFSVTEAETYTVSLSYEGCTLTSSKTISNLDPQITLASTAQLACVGDLNLNPTITNTNTNTSYEWSGPDGFSATTSSVNISKSGTYTILVKKNGTTPCGTKEIFVGDRPQTPEAPELIATELSIDPENASTLIARGCPTTVQWSYVSNDPVEPSTAPITQEPQTVNTSLSIVESVTTPELPLSFQTTSFQTSATYTAACMGACGLSTSSLPVTIFKNICGIKVDADKKAVAPGTLVTLVALSCEPANITWSTGQTGTRSIIVSPSTTTTYFAVCQLPTTGKSCSSSVEIKVSSNECPSSFTITASSTSVQKGDIVTLAASGCTGNLSWSNGVSDLGFSTLKIMPLVSTDVYAICSRTDGNICFSNPVKVTVNSPSSSDCFLYVNSFVKNHKFLKPDKWSVKVVFGGCPNGKVVFSQEGNYKEASPSNDWFIAEILGDITVKASCIIDGNIVCEKSLLISEPTDNCFNNLLIFENGYLYNSDEANTFILFDEKGKKINQVAASSVRIPISVVDKIYTAKFTSNCPDLSIRIAASSFKNRIVWYEGNSTSIMNSDTREVGQYSYDFNSDYLVRMALAPNNSCNGQVVWTNNQDPTFQFTGPQLFFQNSNAYVVSSNGTSIQAPFLPFPRTTTTYYATCYQNGVAYPATNSKTLVVNSFGECIRITPKEWQIAQGNTIEWSASGCLGQITWSIDGNNIGTGNKLLHTPLVATTPKDIVYTATCSNPSCSQTGKIRVQPCQVTISASKTLAKLAEPVSLTSSGCSGGQIVWSTGEIARSIVVKPLAPTSYTAQCKVGNQLLCASNNLTVTIDAQPPVDIQCSTDFSLSAPTNFVKCTTSPITINPIGCPTGSTILWQNSVTQPYNEPYKFTPQSTTTITAVCVSPYGTQFNATASIEIVATNTLSVSSTDVIAGIPTVVSASGCATNSCQEGTYRWKNSKGEVVFVGSNYKVTLLESDTYTITCDQGGSVNVTLTPKKEGDCEITPTLLGIIDAYNGYLMLSAKNCDANQPIYWYKKTGKLDGANPSPPIWQLAYTNVKKITEAEPGLDQIFVYAVVCTSNNKSCYTEKAYYQSLERQKNYLTGTNSISITIGGGDPITPDPCSAIPAGEKGKRNDYAGIQNSNNFRLLSEWCPGTQVEWFLEGTKIATLAVPSGFVNVPHDWSTYTYTCKLSNGTLCEGEYELPTPPAKAPYGLRLATNLSAQASVDCPSTLPLSTPLAVELASLICTHVELLKNPDGSMSSVKVAAFLAALKTSVSTRYAASGITVSFPAHDAAVIAAIMAQNCTQAGQLLAAPNTATVTPTQFNTVKNATHQPILDDLKGVLIQQCSSSQAPPLAITDSNAPNGRVAAYIIDYNRLFIAPDGRAVKLPAGATPKFFTFSFSWDAPPAGTLQGFETANKVMYFAEILSGSGIFKGYRRSSPLCPEEYYKDPLYVTAPTAPAPVYYFQSFTQSPNCGYDWVESSYQFVPTNGTTVSLPLITTGAVNNTSYFANCPTTDEYILSGNVKYYKTAALSTTEKQQLERLWGALQGKYGFNGAITYIEGADINNEKIKQEGDAKGLKEFVPTAGRIKLGTKYLLLFYGAGTYTACELQAINKNIDALQKSSLYKYDFNLTNQWLSDFFQPTDEGIIGNLKNAIRNGEPLSGNILERAQWSKNLMTTAAFVYYAGFAKLGCSLGEEVYYTQTGTNQDGSAIWQLNSGQSCGKAFGAGALKSLTEDLDVVTMLAGVSELVKEAITQSGQNWINYPQDLRDFQTKLSTDPATVTSDDIVKILPPPVKTNLQAAQKVANVAQFFYQYYGPDVNCWRAGNLSAQVVPVVLTVGVVLVPKVATVVAKGVGRLGRLATTMTPNTLAGKITDGLAEFYDIATTAGSKIKQSIIRSADGKIDNIYEEVQENGQTVAKKICGSCLAQNTAVFGTNATLENLQPQATVQTLEKDGSIGSRNVWGKVGRKVQEYAKVFVRGEAIKSSTDHEFKTSEGWKPASYLRKGVLLFSLALNSFVAVDSAFVVHDPLQVEGLSLGEVQGYGVGALGIVVAQSPRCLSKVSASEAAYAELQRLFPANKLNEIIDIMDELPNTYTLEKLDGGPLRLIDNTTSPTKEWVEFADNSITCKGGLGNNSNSTLRNQFLNKKLLPNRTYNVDGFKFTTDNFIKDGVSNPRVNLVEIDNLELGPTPVRRDGTEQARTKTVKDGNLGSPPDDGGHNVGAQFNGPVEQINYDPQNQNINRSPSSTNGDRGGEWYQMEKEWADILKGTLTELRGKPVTPPITNIKINKFFDDVAHPLRASKYEVTFKINGETFSNTIFNPF